MKKVIMGVLLGLVVLSVPIQAKANSLSYIDTSESDGIPTEIRQYAELCGSEYNICPELLESIAFAESSFNPTAANGPCYGLMQVNCSIHHERIEKYGWTAEDMADPYKNMMIASDYLKELFDQYEDVGLVLMVYNGNNSAIPEYKRTGTLSRYATKILDQSEEWERKHGK